MKKLLCILCALLMLVSVITGCSSSDESTGDTAAPSGENGTRDDIVIALSGEPTALCSMISPQTVTTFVSTQLYDSLVICDTGADEPQPALATDWEINDDSSEVIFTLRDDVYFHNGEKMTADDVVFSFTENLRLGICETVLSYYDHMEKVDDSHVKLVLKQPFANVLVAVGTVDCSIVSQSAYEADPDAFGRNPVGTGPYKFSEWKTGEYIKLVANEDYWGGAPSIKNITFKIFNDKSAISLALENGEIDLAIDVSSSDKNRIENTEGLSWLSSDGMNNAWIFFNFNEDSHFADPNVRMAVAYAIDKEAVTQGVTDGLGTPATSGIYGAWQGYSPENYMAPQNDLEKAKEYMAASPYPDGFDVQVTTINTPNYYKIWEVVQPMLAEIGINVEIEKVDQGTWNSEVYWPGNFEINGWQASQGFADFDDHRVCWRSGAFLNSGNLNDPHLDELLDAQDVATSIDERLEIIKEAMVYMCDNALVVPLFNYPNFIAMNSNLTGVAAGPQQGRYRVCEWSWAN